MKKSIDLVSGMMFQYWRIIEEGKKGQVLCECTGCGQVTKIVHRTNLIRGVSRSCGCKNDEIKKATNIKRHGVPIPLLRPENIEKTRQVLIKNKNEISKKRKKTMMEKYGREHYLPVGEERERLLERRRPQILKGETRDLWEVLEDRNGSKLIKCICRGCDQTIKQLTMVEFRRGGRSCGCLTKKDRVGSRIKRNKELGIGPKILKGDKFGFWEALEDYNNDKKMRCLCTGCNVNIKELSPHELIDLKTKSCGCKKFHNVAKALFANGKLRVMTSKGQMAIYNYLLEASYDVKLNWPILRYNADISLRRGSTRLVIEYDGSGHGLHMTIEECEKKDQIRDRKMIDLGYRILRFRSKKDRIPNNEFVIDEVEKMLASDLSSSLVDLDLLTLKKNRIY